MAKMQSLTAKTFEKICFIATDMDGTLTRHGRFTPALLQALTDLTEADITVLIVTGRSAGWVSAIAHYLPVAGAIAENGGALFIPRCDRDTTAPELLVPITDLIQHRQALQTAFQSLQVKFPHLREAADNAYRLTDWTFDVAGFSVVELDWMRDHLAQQGWGFTYSTVQCHIKLAEQEKSAGLQSVLQRHFPQIDRTQLITVGDSPNDESLFNPDLFPVSVGVANIRDYCDRMQYQPHYITTAAEAEGFCELAQYFPSPQKTRDCQKTNPLPKS